MLRRELSTARCAGGSWWRSPNVGWAKRRRRRAHAGHFVISVGAPLRGFAHPTMSLAPARTPHQEPLIDAADDDQHDAEAEE